MLSWRGMGHPQAGGAEISTHEHTKRWVKAGHSVTLFTSYYPNSKKQERIEGIDIIRRGNQSLGVHFHAFWWYIFESHPKFDLVVDQFHGIPFFTPIFVKEKKLAFIHEVTKEVWRLNPLSNPFNFVPTIFGTFFEPFIFKLLYKNIPFMTVSDSTKTDLISWGIPSNNITVIHNGFIVPTFNLPNKEKNPTIIFLGALNKDKGIEDALRVFSIVNKSSRNWKFWVVGKGESHYLAQLKLLAKKLNIDERTKFYGFVTEGKKFKLLSKAHVLLNTSVREGWGLVVIEAAAVGTPTAALNVPGLRDSVVNGKTGIIDKNNSVNSIADEIINLLSDNQKYQKMREEAVKWSKRFSWKESVIRSLDLINKIMKNSNNQFTKS